jgi:uncharacterized protein YfaS (alpha-2-macroglobulin family)
VLYGSLTKQMAEYQYKLKAISSGTFNVAPVYVSSMYEKTLRAHASAGKINVVEDKPVTAK